MKEKKQPIVLDLDIFIHLMTSAYREGFKAGAEQNSHAHDLECASAVTSSATGCSTCSRNRKPPCSTSLSRLPPGSLP